MTEETISHSFYQRDVATVAKELMGKRLVTRIDQKRVSGIIVETEAYLPVDDSACHGARGLTPGNRSMFEDAGTAYVYPIHGRFCFNVVTQKPGEPCAVLIRACQPEQGLATMKLRRNNDSDKLLSSGPARLCEAFGIDRSVDGINLCSKRKVWLEHNPAPEWSHLTIVSTERIGVTSAEEMKMRFVVQKNPFASGPLKLRT